MYNVLAIDTNLLQPVIQLRIIAKGPLTHLHGQALHSIACFDQDQSNLHGTVFVHQRQCGLAGSEQAAFVYASRKESMAPTKRKNC